MSGSKQASQKTVTSAAADGDERELLVALRARIATTVEDESTPPRDLAALSRRLMEITKEIKAIDAAAKQEEQDGRASPDEELDPSTV